MPVITGAIAAVTIAAAVTTTATVAAAVVAVSTLVATVGLAITAVGMITGNKDLLKVGGIMGMVGLAGGIAGVGLGALGAGSSAASSAAGQFANPELAASISGDIAQAANPVVGAGSVLAPATAQAAPVGAAGVLAPAADTPGLLTTGAAQTGTGSTAVQNAPPLAGIETGAPQAGVTAPLASNAGTVAPLASNAGQSVSPVLNAAQTGLKTLGSPPVGSSADARAQALLDKMTDIQKQQLMTTGVQALAGFGGGILEGITAEDKIALERLINSQNETQRQYLNKNNAYAPRLTFASNPGLLTTRRP